MFNQTTDVTVIRRVAIVGSGLAGLTAAILLQSHGHDVTVFEKSRGPGGRLAAKRVNGSSVDIGAQYFTARNPDFLPFLARNAGPDSFAKWHGRFGFQAPTGDWWAFPEEPRYVGQPRMTAITRALSVHVPVEAETRVGKLARREDGWFLEASGGRDLGEFHQVIITAPPAQARALLADSGLGFLAEQLNDAVSRVLPCWAVAAHFPECPWPDHEGMRCQHPALDWVANNSSKPGRNGQGQWWVMHASSAWSQQHLDTAPDRVAGKLVDAFRELTGYPGMPDEMLSHRWLYARSDGGGQPGHLWFEENGIGLAGDWLSGGRVEGAFNSATGLVQAMASQG